MTKKTKSQKNKVENQKKEEVRENKYVLREHPYSSRGYIDYIDETKENVVYVGKMALIPKNEVWKETKTAEFIDPKCILKDNDMVEPLGALTDVEDNDVYLPIERYEAFDSKTGGLLVLWRMPCKYKKK